MAAATAEYCWVKEPTMLATILAAHGPPRVGRDP